MLATFATTTNLFVKNKLRHDVFEKVEKPWYFEEEFFEKHKEAKRDLSEDIK